MRCRAGALRRRRSLRDLYIPFGLRLPMVARGDLVSSIGRPVSRHEVADVMK
jgi:hypothetical protein